jgi:hypothetical protein
MVWRKAVIRGLVIAAFLWLLTVLTNAVRRLFG